VKQLQIEFALVNDGKHAVDPKLGQSKIVVNGKEWADSGFILSNGPRPSDFPPLKPGQRLLIAYALGDRFARPREYTVEWKGERFRAAPIRFRVLGGE
jgi:hypothetical protein